MRCMGRHFCGAEPMQHSLQVQQGHLVYDPFVGTGSILVAAAYYGAYTLGADIDIRVVRDGKYPFTQLVANLATCICSQ